MRKNYFRLSWEWVGFAVFCGLVLACAPKAPPQVSAIASPNQPARTPELRPSELARQKNLVRSVSARCAELSDCMGALGHVALVGVEDVVRCHALVFRGQQIAIPAECYEKSYFYLRGTTERSCTGLMALAFPGQDRIFPCESVFFPEQSEFAWVTVQGQDLDLPEIQTPSSPPDRRDSLRWVRYSASGLQRSEPARWIGATYFAPSLGQRGLDSTLAISSGPAAWGMEGSPVVTSRLDVVGWVKSGTTLTAVSHQEIQEFQRKRTDQGRIAFSVRPPLMIGNMFCSAALGRLNSMRCPQGEFVPQFRSLDQFMQFWGATDLSPELSPENR